MKVFIIKHPIAIISFGGIGNWHVENVSSRIDDITVKGIYDIQTEVCDKAQEKGMYIYSSIDELLQDEEVELITLAIPNDSHKVYVFQCLTADKNIICEKPVTQNLAELVEIIAVAKESNKVFSIHQDGRRYKDFVIIKKF